MNSGVFKNIIRFVSLILLQVLIFDNIQLHSLVVPIIFPLIILLLPLNLPNGLVMLIAMFTGLTVDMFNNTLGMSAAACVFMAFLRPVVLSWLTPRGGYEQGHYPSLMVMGFSWFIVYASICILCYHLAYFFIEAFSVRFMAETILKILLSTLISLLLFIVHQIIFQTKS